MIKIMKWIFLVFSILIFVAFFAIVYAHVFSSQLGNADDAAIAVVAKNLASGNGYATSIAFDGSYGIEAFSPGISTGPALVLPAAILILIFGNTFWVPGFVVATISLILLIIIFFKIKKQTNLLLAFNFLVLLILFFYNFTAGRHFGQWYVLMGEIPAAFSTILGVLIFVIAPYKRANVVLAFLFFGLAFNMKMLSLLGFLPIIFWFAYSLIREKEQRKLLLANLIIGLLIFATPYFLFEIWKLLSLGILGYYENLRNFIHSFAWMAVGHDKESISLFEKLIQRSDHLHDHFGFSMFALFFVAIGMGIVIYFFAEKKYVKLLFPLLILGAGIHFFYWIFISNGWFRYFLPGLFLYFTALSCIVFVRLPKSLIILSISIVAFIFLGYAKSLKRPIEDVKWFGFYHNNRLKNLVKTVDYLKEFENNKPFVYAWWSSIVDVEYAMPTLQNFKRYDQLIATDYERELIVVRNTLIPNSTHDKRFSEWKNDNVEVLLDAPPFLVSRWKYKASVLGEDGIIDFSVKGNSNDYTTYGWGTQTDDFRWTEASNAGLTFLLNDKSPDTLELKLQAWGNLTNGLLDHQTVRVSINKHLAGEWHVSNEDWFTVLIPPDFLADDGIVHIDFCIPNAISLYKLGFSWDTRELGLAVKKVSVKKTQNHFVADD